MRFPQAIPARKKLYFLLMLLPLLLITGLLIQRSYTPVYAEDLAADLNVLASFQEPAPMSQGERIMRALSAAYPTRIGPAELKRLDDGTEDWAFQIRGRWFFYAEGRLLPEALRHRTEEYRAMGFNFNYPVELPSWESGAEQRAARTRSYEESRNRAETRQPQAPRPPGPRRPNYFFEALWNSSTREQAGAQQRQVDFLGRRVTVHSDISPIVSQISEIIMTEARTNQTVRQWVNSLGTTTGWNWRNVASSGNRSFHSYGIAIDILPTDLRGQATYWLWTSQHNPLWWNTPYSGRWHPPDMVVKTFESYGFIWGGKWGNFDTMHFEYRPEIFILSNIPMVHIRQD